MTSKNRPLTTDPRPLTVADTQGDQLPKVSAMNLCLNCLHTGAETVEVGREKGNQRDPYRETVALCPPCRDALTSGRFDVLHERYNSERTVRRDGES